jgi:predicted murein hydrolase (TIGR00659 family)
MMNLHKLWPLLIWSGLTVALYWLSQLLHRRGRVWWLAPAITAPLLLVALALAFHVSYHQYIGGAGWLITLFAPATVAFAVPIYEERRLIRRYWPLLVLGAVAGSITAIASSWVLARWLGLDENLRLSLLPRSISTPFALPVSGKIGGTPSLTAVFVLITGIFGAAIGESLLAWLPLRSVVARGALFGMGAHAFGTAKAHQISQEIGAVAGLVMVFVGLLNVLAAPLLAWVSAGGSH